MLAEKRLRNNHEHMPRFAGTIGTLFIVGRLTTEGAQTTPNFMQARPWDSLHNGGIEERNKNASMWLRKAVLEPGGP